MVDCHVGVVFVFDVHEGLFVLIDVHEGLMLALGRIVLPRVRGGLGAGGRHEGGPRFHEGTVCGEVCGGG